MRYCESLLLAGIVYDLTSIEKDTAALGPCSTKMVDLSVLRGASLPSRSTITSGRDGAFGLGACLGLASAPHSPLRARQDEWSGAGCLKASGISWTRTVAFLVQQSKAASIK
jgi:hypothetical protein